jgi:hypothetical protein
VGAISEEGRIFFGSGSSAGLAPRPSWLYDRDGSHPTPAGSHLAACVFVAALFGQNPVGLEVEVPGIGNAERLQFQQAAWRAVRRTPAARA